MIYGNGIDIVSIDRIARIYSHFGNIFANKILTSSEFTALKQHKNYEKQGIVNQHWIDNFLAKRFSAKEATAKALGTGIGGYFSFHDIEVFSNNSGKPTLIINQDKLASFIVKSSDISNFKAKMTTPQAITPQNFYFHLSISDETKTSKGFAIANVIAEIII
jgi:holo-[acyl-carrier protein] synthase